MKNSFLIIVLFTFTAFIFFLQEVSCTPTEVSATQFDVGVTKLDLAKWIPDDKEYLVVSGKVRNFGVQPISWFWIHFQVNSGDILDYKVTDFSLLQNEELPFVHPNTFVPVLGNHNIKVWTSLPNGQEDENPKNDTLHFSFTIYKTQTSRPRTILLEGFTASSCSACVPGNVVLKNVLAENGGNYALIKYQMNYPGAGDPYYTPEIGTRSSVYGVTSIPILCVDGSAFRTHTHQIKNSDLLFLQSVPATVTLDVDYYVENQTVYAKAKIIATEDISNANLKLYMAIVEKETYKNVGSNGEEEFEHVMKKFMPHQDGIDLSNLQVNAPCVKFESWEFMGDYRLPENAYDPINHEIEHSVEDFGNLLVIAWIQNAQNKVVFQAANGVETLGVTLDFSAFPAAGGTVTATLNGSPVMSGTPINMGEEITFTATSNEGYELVEWWQNDTQIADQSNSITITTDDNFLDVTAIFVQKVGINNNSLSNVLLYPNPFANSFTVSNAENVRKISITNLFGQVIKEKMLTGTHTIIFDTSDLATGFYIVNLLAGSGEKTVRKMVKQNL